MIEVLKNLKTKKLGLSMGQMEQMKFLLQVTLM